MWSMNLVVPDQDSREFHGDKGHVNFPLDRMSGSLGQRKQRIVIGSSPSSLQFRFFFFFPVLNISTHN